MGGERGRWQHRSPPRSIAPMDAPAPPLKPSACAAGAPTLTIHCCVDASGCAGVATGSTAPPPLAPASPTATPPEAAWRRAETRCAASALPLLLPAVCRPPGACAASLVPSEASSEASGERRLSPLRRPPPSDDAEGVRVHGGGASREKLGCSRCSPPPHALLPPSTAERGSSCCSRSAASTRSTSHAVARLAVRQRRCHGQGEGEGAVARWSGEESVSPGPHVLPVGLVRLV